MALRTFKTNVDRMKSRNDTPRSLNETEGGFRGRNLRPVIMRRAKTFSRKNFFHLDHHHKLRLSNSDNIRKNHEDEKKKKEPRSIWYPSTCHKRPLSPKIHVFTLKFGAHEHGAARNRRKPGEATEQWQPGSKKTRAEGVANSLFSRKKTQRVYFFFYSRNAFNPHTSSSRWLRNTILS